MISGNLLPAVQRQDVTFSINIPGFQPMRGTTARQNLVPGGIHTREFTITKHTDVASPNLFRLSMSRRAFNVTVSALNGAKQLQFLHAQVSSVEAADEGPEETITFTYGTLVVSYG